MSNLSNLVRSTGERKNTATKIAAKYGLSPDIAAAVSAVLRNTLTNPDRPEYVPPQFGDLTMPEIDAAIRPVLPDVDADVREIRASGWWPLVEPNVTAAGRIAINAPTLPIRRGYDDDGAVHVNWASMSDHHAALQSVAQWYFEHHNLAREDRRHNALYGGLEPITVIPVRHHYADGSEPHLSLMADDGTGRLLAARLWLQESADQFVAHPYANPFGWWPNDVVTLKTFLGAFERMPIPLTHTLNIVLPTAGMQWMLPVDARNFRMHTTPEDAASAMSGDTMVDAWIDSMDMYPPFALPQADDLEQDEAVDRMASWLFAYSREDLASRYAFILGAARISPPKRREDIVVERALLAVEQPKSHERFMTDTCMLIRSALDETTDPDVPFGDIGIDWWRGALEEGLAPGNWTSSGVLTAELQYLSDAWGLCHAASIGLFGEDSGWRKAIFSGHTQPGSPAESEAFITFLAELVTDHPYLVEEMASAAARDQRRVPLVNPDGSRVMNADGEQVWLDARLLQRIVTIGL